MRARIDAVVLPSRGHRGVHPGLGAALVGVGVLGVLLVTFTLRRRYGSKGERWAQRLDEAVLAGSSWREVDVWLVRPGGSRSGPPARPKGAWGS